MVGVHQTSNLKDSQFSLQKSFNVITKVKGMTVTRSNIAWYVVIFSHAL